MFAKAVRRLDGFRTEEPVRDAELATACAVRPRTHARPPGIYIRAGEFSWLSNAPGWPDPELATDRRARLHHEYWLEKAAA